MSTQLAQLDLTEPATSEIAAPHVPRDDVRDSEHPSNVARGIINAVLIATPFWVLFAVALYLLI
jgi:hypothetical protein